MGHSAWYPGLRSPKGQWRGPSWWHSNQWSSLTSQGEMTRRYVSGCNVVGCKQHPLSMKYFLPKNNNNNNKTQKTTTKKQNPTNLDQINNSLIGKHWDEWGPWTTTREHSEKTQGCGHSTRQMTRFPQQINGKENIGERLLQIKRGFWDLSAKCTSGIWILIRDKLTVKKHLFMGQAGRLNTD